MTQPTFDQRFAQAIEVARQYSQFSAFDPSYPPLCKRLWIQQDPDASGFFTRIEQCNAWAAGAVAAGWADCAPTTAQLAIWSALLQRDGFISVEQFFEVSENQNFSLGAVPAQIMAMHHEWKAQGGDLALATKPCAGLAALSVVDWRKVTTDRPAVVAQIRHALQTDGFFLLAGHGLEAITARTLAYAREFFARAALAEQEKEKRRLEAIRVELAHRPMMKCARGYEPLPPPGAFVGGEALNPALGPDRKRTFDFSLNPTGGDATNMTCMALGNNVWPSEGSLAPAPGATNAATAAADAASPNALPQFMLARGPSEVSPPHPVESALAPVGFKACCEEYMGATAALARALVELVFQATGLGEESYKKDVEPLFAAPLVVQRLLNYPPQSKVEEARAKAAMMSNPNFGFPQPQPGRRSPGRSPTSKAANAAQPAYNDRAQGSGAHVDFGALTLVAEDLPGLEVHNRGNKNWLSVVPPAGAFIVNTGYVLEKLTNGKFPATRHRVLNHNAADRFSLALFYDPAPTAEIGPLPALLAAGEAVKYEKCMAGTKGVRFGSPAALAKAAHLSFGQ